MKTIVSKSVSDLLRQYTEFLLTSKDTDGSFNEKTIYQLAVTFLQQLKKQSDNLENINNNQEHVNFVGQFDTKKSNNKSSFKFQFLALGQAQEAILDQIIVQGENESWIDDKSYEQKVEAIANKIQLGQEYTEELSLIKENLHYLFNLNNYEMLGQES